MHVCTVFPSIRHSTRIQYDGVDTCSYVSSPNRTLRLCNEDCVIKGVTIKKGVQVFIPMNDIHMDPEIWPEPDKFIPERCVCMRAQCGCKVLL